MKIAVVGTGSVARRHLANLLAIGVRDLIAVSEYSKKDHLIIEGTQIPAVQAIQTAYNLSIDAIVISSPTAFHLNHLKTAVAANLHVYLEKPAATSADGLTEIAEEAERLGLVVAMGTQNRFHESLIEIRQAVRSGEVGQVLNVFANLGEHISDYHPGEDYRQSYTARADLGGGVLLTQIHQIDYLNWIFGPFTHVSAVGGKHSDLEIDVEDNITYLLRTADNVPVVGHLDYLQRPKRVTLEIFGTRCSYKWNYFANRLTKIQATIQTNEKHNESKFDRNALFVQSMEDFLSAIGSGTKPRSTLKDGIAAVKIADAIRKAFKSGQTQAITP